MKEKDIVRFAEEYLQRPLSQYHKDLLLLHYEHSRQTKAINTPLRHGNTSISNILNDYYDYKGDDKNGTKTMLEGQK